MVNVAVVYVAGTQADGFKNAFQGPGLRCARTFMILNNIGVCLSGASFCVQIQTAGHVLDLKGSVALRGKTPLLRSTVVLIPLYDSRSGGKRAIGVVQRKTAEIAYQCVSIRAVCKIPALRFQTVAFPKNHLVAPVHGAAGASSRQSPDAAFTTL